MTTTRTPFDLPDEAGWKRVWRYFRQFKREQQREESKRKRRSYD